MKAPLNTPVKDQNSFRRHEYACCFYRERWIPDDGRLTPDGETVLYEVYCLQGMPPKTPGEQAQCFQKRTHCWRTGELLRAMGSDPAS
ncbi:MAG: hypothetical protein ACYDAG_13945 [Chloroflexota bacterium]